MGPELDERAPSVNPSAQPVFIVGALRSGTTLLRLMLSGHPAISGVREFEFAVSQTKRGAWPDLPSYYEFLKRDRVFSIEPLTIDPELDYPALIRSFLKQRHADAGPEVRVWADVIHSAFHRCPGIWADAKYIHLVRDPRDVARSSIGMGWHGNAYCGLRVWMEAERRWNLLCKRTAASNRFELRYEDLLRNPVQKLTELCEFLGLAYDSRLLSYPERTTYGPPDASFVEQWREKMSPRDIELVESACRDLMVARGYRISGRRIRRPGSIEHTLLVLDSRWRRLKMALERYGLALVVRQRATRLGFGSQQFQQQTYAQTNAVDADHLK